MKQELAGLGYSLSYIDDWQAKTRLYRHRPSYNTQGEISDVVGTYIDNVPGNPDYVLRKARIGLFPWKPSSSCECKWCRDSYVEPQPEPEVNSDMATKTCELCGFTAEAANLAGASSKLTFHKRKSHPDV
jgi:hypothetical protein